MYFKPAIAKTKQSQGKIRLGANFFLKKRLLGPSYMFIEDLTSWQNKCAVTGKDYTRSSRVEGVMSCELVVI